MYTHVHTLFRFIYFGKLVEVEARSGKKRASLKYRRDAGARVHACVRACVRSFVRSVHGTKRKRKRKKKKENERESRVEDRGRDLRWILRIVGHLLRTYIFDLEICFMRTLHKRKSNSRALVNLI